MNYDKYIVKLYLRKNKKLFFLFSIVIILSCIFAISITIFHDSIAKTDENKRKDIYGSWHTAVYNSNDVLFNQLKNHATIHKAGKMSIQGFVMKENNNQVGAIGSVDEDIIDQGIALLEGSFPEKDDEIAVEMSYLSMLGYSFELGQPIRLDIAVYDKVKGEVIQFEKTFTLTGVIQNYSSIWKSNSNQLVSFFITEDALNLKLPSFAEHIFCQLYDDFAMNASEMQMLIMDNGMFELNDYTYLYYSTNKRKDSSVLNNIVLIILIIATSAFFIINILNTLMKKQSKSFAVMRSIGASRSQIFFIYLKVLMVILIGAFSTGITLGLSLSYLGFMIIKKFLISNYIYDLQAKKLVLLMAIIIISVFLFTIASILAIRKITLYGNVQLYINRRLKIKASKKTRPLRMFQIINILNRVHTKETVIRFILTVLTFLIISSTSYQTYRKYQEYREYASMYDSDYDIGFMITYLEPLTRIEQKELQKIHNIYGIEHISAYQISNYMPISWEKRSQSQYADVTSNFLFSKFAKRSSPHATAFGILEDERDWEFYIKEVDEGKVTYDQLIHGNEVIIYLPNLYLTKDVLLNGDYEAEYKRSENASTLYVENTLSVGDMLQIKGNDGYVEVKIGAIITNFESKNPKSFLSKPYTIICNTKLYNKLVETDKEGTYEFVQVFCNKNANYERTDIEMSKINGNTSVLNHRLNRVEAKLKLFESLMVSLILSFSVIIISLVVHYNSQIARMDSDIIRNHIFHMLGMEQWKVHMIYFYSTLINCIGAIFIGFIMIFMYQIVEYYRQIDFNANIFQITKYIKGQYFNDFSWPLVLIFSFGFISLNIMIIYIPMNKQKKKRIIL